MNDSYIVVVLDNATGDVFAAADWECVTPSETSDAILRGKAALAVAEIVAKIGTVDITVSVTLRVA